MLFVLLPFSGAKKLLHSRDASPAPQEPNKSQFCGFFFLHFSALSRVYFIADFDVSKILRGFFSHKTTNATVRTFSPRGD